MTASNLTNSVDYYRILKVSPSADFEEIRASFKRLILESHPDKNPGRRQWSEKRVRELIQAYDVLSNESKRDAFDRYRRAAGRNRPEEPFFFRKQGPGARALRVLHFLLHDRHGAAVEILDEMEEQYGKTFLLDYLDSRDYLDCLFLLAESFIRDRNYPAAAERLRAFYLHERHSRFPRHYFAEVVGKLKDLYLRKLPRVLEPELLLRYLREASTLDLSSSEEIVRLKKLAEVQALTGALGAARQSLGRIQRLDPATSGLERIEELLNNP